MNSILDDFKIDDLMKMIQPKMPFYNERQFQFELALAIKELYRDNDNIQIGLEAYYGKEDNETTDERSSIVRSRKYTDIVVYDDKRNFIAIELKYALKGKSGKGDKNRFEYKKEGKEKEESITIAKKGAINNCRYDFLYDVHRLEEIAENHEYENKNLKTFVKGYAIIISNEKLMWEENEKKVCDRNFHIAKEVKKDCFWYKKNSDDKDEEKNKKGSRQAFELNNSYKCDWKGKEKEEFYFKDKDCKSPSPSFKYLVIEVLSKK